MGRDGRVGRDLGLGLGDGMMLDAESAVAGTTLISWVRDKMGAMLMI